MREPSHTKITYILNDIVVLYYQSIKAHVHGLLQVSAVVRSLMSLLFDIILYYTVGDHHWGLLTTTTVDWAD